MAATEAKAEKKYWEGKFWITIAQGAGGGFVDYTGCNKPFRVTGLSEKGDAILKDRYRITEIDQEKGVIYTENGNVYSMENFHPMYNEFLEKCKEFPNAAVAVNRNWRKFDIISGGEIVKEGMPLDLGEIKLKDIREQVLVFESKELGRTLIIAPFSTKLSKFGIGGIEGEVAEAIKKTSK